MKSNHGIWSNRHPLTEQAQNRWFPFRSGIYRRAWSVDIGYKAPAAPHFTSVIFLLSFSLPIYVCVWNKACLFNKVHDPKQRKGSNEECKTIRTTYTWLKCNENRLTGLSSPMVPVVNTYSKKSYIINRANKWGEQ